MQFQSLLLLVMLIKIDSIVYFWTPKNISSFQSELLRDAHNYPCTKSFSLKHGNMIFLVVKKEETIPQQD